MKINFIIPNIPSKPTGGYKVMYEYANCFAENGHDVYLYHIATVEGIKYNIPHWLRMIRTKLFYGDSKPKWFPISDKVKTINIPRIDSQYIRSADINMLTMWAEVLDFAKIGDLKGKRVNLIQGYEVWFGSEEQVHNSYKTGTINIAISNYLADIVERETGERPAIVKNSINPKFKLTKSIEGRQIGTISMLYSEHECKGSKFGIEALKIAQKSVPGLKVEMFGTFDCPDGLPEWIHYQKEPKDLCALYNSVSMHLSPSVNDGWDLPCTESMKCGCALVCTDIAGHKEYAREKETALLAEAEDANGLAQRIIELANNEDLRISLAKTGLQETEKYTIDKSYEQILDILNKQL